MLFPFKKNPCSMGTVLIETVLSGDPLYLQNTRIYGHLRWPFFLPFRYGKLLELVSICISLNNLEGMTIFGRNDTNTEGMTIIQKGHWRPRVKVGEGHGYKNEK